MSELSSLSENELLQESYNYDPDAELNPNVMVPDGWNLASLKLGKRGIKVRAGKGGAFLLAHIVAQVQAPGQRYDKRTLNDNAMSIVFESSGTSPLHVLAKLTGFPVPSRGTLEELKQAITNGLASEPQVRIRTRWEAQINHGTQVAPDYETLAKGMSQFPQAADGTFVPYVEFEGTRVDARERIVDFKSASATAGSN